MMRDKGIPKKTLIETIKLNHTNIPCEYITVWENRQEEKEKENEKMIKDEEEVIEENEMVTKNEKMRSPKTYIF